MVELRTWCLDDAVWYADIAGHDELIQRFTTESADVTADEVRAAIEELLAGAPGQVGYLIADRTTRERLGNIALWCQDGVGHLSYWLSPSARGRGAATAAVRLLSARAFTDLGLREIRMYAREDNMASRAVAERAGFQRDPGRDRVREIKGQPWPEVAFTLDRADPTVA